MTTKLEFYVPGTAKGNARNHRLMRKYPAIAALIAIGWAVLAIPAWLGTPEISMVYAVTGAALSIYGCTVLCFHAVEAINQELNQ